MKTTTTALLFLSTLVLSTIATPTAPLQFRYTHIQRASSNSTSSTPAEAGSTITIQEGDTLSSIAAAAGVGICDIAKANEIEDPDLIQAGATLKIPASTGSNDDTSCLKTAA